jgi:hypothetical protein
LKKIVTTAATIALAGISVALITVTPDVMNAAISLRRA